MLQRISFLLLAVAAVAAPACGADSNRQRSAAPPTGDAAATVVVADMGFEPEAVEIDAGEAVTWSFEDRMPHDVKLDGGPASPKMKTGDWQHTFEEPGTYDYVCTLHPIMTGTVTVG